MALLEIFDPKAAPRPIGIDLGTTHSLVAYMRDDGPICVEDCDGVALLPSVVQYSERGEVTVGQRAQETAQEAPERTLTSIKRWMGRGADEALAQPMPWRVVPREEGDANVVRVDVGGRVVTPVEVSAEILRALKRLAEDDLGAVGGAVITVPAYFDDAQRQATKDAGKLAGLNVLRLLNEPTAAALAYGLDKKQNGTFAVYDLGGGTFDITVLTLDDGVFQVRSVGGDSALGGDDFDHAIADELRAAFAIEAPTPAVLRQLLDSARAAKHALTDAERTTIRPPAGVDAAPLELSRARFSELIEPWLKKTGSIARRALKDAELQVSDIDGVILVGGSTRVPAVRAYVQQLLGKEPLADIDPDRVVALGAAVQASLLAGTGQTDDILLLDVLPLSLGIEVGGGVVDKILPRNTTVPANARALYTTQADEQTGFLLHVVQGERELARDCRSLARFSLTNIPPMPAGLARLSVSFEVDEDGLLRVTAREERTGIEQVIKVEPSYGLSDEDAMQMLLDAYDHGEEDLDARRLAEAKVDAARISLAVEKSLREGAALLEPGEGERIEQALRDVQREAAGERIAALQNAVDALDHATRAFAERRMNHALEQATRGRALGELEERVEHSADAEQAHAAGGFASQQVEK